MAGPTSTAPSARVRLAQLAHDAALLLDGVRSLDTGTAGTFLTAGGGARVPGVVATVAPEGGYDVSLRLVCALVPLPALTDRVRDAVHIIAAEAGLAVQTVTILVTDVLLDDADGPA